MDKTSLLEEIRDAAARYDSLPPSDRPALRPQDSITETPVRPAWSQQ